VPGPFDRFFYRYQPPFSANYGMFFGGITVGGKGGTTLYNRVDRLDLGKIATVTSWHTMSEATYNTAGSTSKGSGGINFRTGGLLAASGLSKRHDSQAVISTGAMTYHGDIATTLQGACGGATKTHYFTFAGTAGTGGGDVIRKKLVKSTAVPVATTFTTIGNGFGGDVNETTNYFFVGPVGSTNTTRLERISSYNGSGAKLWSTFTASRTNCAIAGNENRTWAIGGGGYTSTVGYTSNHSSSTGKLWTSLPGANNKLTAASSQFRSVISPSEQSATPTYASGFIYFDHNTQAAFVLYGLSTGRSGIKSGSGSN